MQLSGRPHSVGFLIIGAQKAATTALARFLAQHPHLSIPSREIHFFDQDNLNWDDPDYESYEKQFLPVESGCVIGEKTPIYLYWDNAVERIYRYNPAIKIIISLRHPAHRAYSHWQMETRRGREDMPFEFAIRDGRQRIGEHDGDRHLAKRIYSYVERGFYAKQIRQVLKFFPQEQILFLTDESLWADPHLTLDRICDFLKVARYENYPENRRFFSNPGTLPPVSSVDLNWLKKLYRKDVLDTQELCNLDLAGWLI